MSREIKFRAWDQKDKKYLLPEKQGFVILPTMPSFGVTLPYENCSNPGNIDEDCIDWADADLLMGRYELEQYTGLKDKNGKEIYEGDIVKVYAWTNLTRGLEYRHTTKVFWQEKYAQFNTTYNDALSDEITQDYFEIVGNIHENPELLGE